jgi:protocatechuate 3,4-dioxygenase beta subunit
MKVRKVKIREANPMSSEQMNNKPVDIDNDNDDLPVGRILSRREALALLGLAGTSLVAACMPIPVSPGASGTPTLNAEAATSVAMEGNPTVQTTAAAEVATVEAVNATTVPSCVVRPEQTEGPYFVDEQLNRSDIRVEPSDGSMKEGAPLTLAFVVSQIADAVCSPLAGAAVDVWHCDALGVYSGVTDPGFDTAGQTWLRGYQVTDENGRVEFASIYPGWYSGRTVHIHFKIRTSTPDNQSYEFTSQLFFDEALTDQVHAREPYAAKGQRDTLNSSDGIYQNGGDQLLLTVAEADGGYTAQFDIAFDLSDSETGQPDGGGQPGGRPGGPSPNGTRRPTG